MNKGRKYEALLFAIILFIITLFCIMYLSIKELEIPRALETVAIIFATAVPSYMGANAYQKKKELEIKAEEEK